MPNNNDRYDAGVIVCATAQPEARRLIRVGKALADAKGVPLEILNVQSVTPSDRAWVEQLDALYAIAREEGARLSVYYHDFPVAVAAAHISRCHASDIVTGLPKDDRPGQFLAMLHTLLPGVVIHMVDTAGREHRLQPAAVDTAAD